MNVSPMPGAGASVLDSLESQFPVANPYPLLAQARAAGAVVSIPFPVASQQKIWLVTRLAEVVEVLKSHQRFTVDHAAFKHNEFFSTRREEGPFMGRTMLNVDEPDHRRLRSLVSKAFTPKFIAGLRPAIQAIADELLNVYPLHGQMDIVQDYAYPLPITVISDMLGVPHSMRDQIRVWSHELVGHERNQASIQAFSAYVAELVAEKRKHPGDDLISLLVQLEDTGDRLDEVELEVMIRLLIFAGHETTSNLISLGTLMLLDHPDQLALLQADSSLVPAAVEEMLRITGPVLVPAPRFVVEDTELGGQHLSKGDLVMAMLASADRDETQFTNPDDLDIARKLNHHVAFGQGIHICLGAPLARLEGDIAFTTLLRRMPDLKLAVPRETLLWRGMVNLRGLKSLPVAF